MIPYSITVPSGARLTLLPPGTSCGAHTNPEAYRVVRVLKQGSVHGHNFKMDGSDDQAYGYRDKSHKSRKALCTDQRQNNKGKTTVTSERIANMRRLRTSGLTLQQIADAVGLSVSRVHVACKGLALILVALLASLDTSAGTVSGAIHTATGGAVSNGTLTFTLTQPAVQSGTASIVTSPVSCYTDSSGNVRGLPTPAVSVLSTNTSSGTLPAATYYLRTTWSNSTGESEASSEQTVILSAQGKVIVTPQSVPASATTFNVYMSSTSGAETKQGTVAGSGSFAAYTQSIALISGAALPGSNTSVCSPLFNDQLQPSYTGYNVSLANSAGSAIPGFPQKWYLSGGASGTINLSSGTPLYSGVVVYPQAVVTTPAANGLQSINGPLSLNGYDLRAVSRLDGFFYVDRTGFATIQAAINALP